MACLKMILAARTGRAIPLLELSRKCTEYGGYTVSPTGQIKGLIYAPVVRFMREEYSLDAEVVTGITADGIARVFQEAKFLIASVHHSIRWPDREPASKGGHLVLVLDAANDVIFHNPSGPQFELSGICVRCGADLQQILCRSGHRYQSERLAGDGAILCAPDFQTSPLCARDAEGFGHTPERHINRPVCSCNFLGYLTAAEPPHTLVKSACPLITNDTV